MLYTNNVVNSYYGTAHTKRCKIKEIDLMKTTTIEKAMNAFFTENGKELVGMGKADRKAVIKTKLPNAPSWVERPSDIPTYFCKLQADAFKPSTMEKNRKDRGFVAVKFDGKYWKVSAELTTEFAGTTEGKGILADLQKLESNGALYYNVSSISSERRHCEFLAKAVSVWYNLAHSPINDIDTVDMKDLQNKERRVEIYKFASKMVEPSTAKEQTK